ncbi:MAG: GNAT family N-acetyltransferase [Acidimicrobiales bacterium]
MPRGRRGGGEPDRLPVLDAGAYDLRGFEPADLDLVRRAAADPLIPLISSVPVPYNDEAGRQFVERQRHRLGEGFGYSFVIESVTVGGEVGTGRPVGSIGLWLRDLDLGRASVGYWVLAGARGRGAATSALGALTRWAQGELGVPRLEAYAEPWNEASIRAAESNGFRAEGLLRGFQVVGGERRDMVMLARLAGDPDGAPGRPR